MYLVTTSDLSWLMVNHPAGITQAPACVLMSELSGGSFPITSLCFSDN